MRQAKREKAKQEAQDAAGGTGASAHMTSMNDLQAHEARRGSGLGGDEANFFGDDTLGLNGGGKGELILDSDLAMLYKGRDAARVRARAAQAEAARERAMQLLKERQVAEAAAGKKGKKGKRKRTTRRRRGGDDDDDDDEEESESESDEEEAEEDSDVEWQPDPTMASSSRSRKRNSARSKAAAAAEKTNGRATSYKLAADGAVDLLDSSDEDEGGAGGSASKRARRGSNASADDSPIPVGGDDSDDDEDNEGTMTANTTADNQQTTEKSAAAAEDDAERIGVTLKAPTATMLARIKPTTLLSRILDHFKKVNKDHIPADKMDACKMRFDGAVSSSSRSPSYVSRRFGRGHSHTQCPDHRSWT